MIRINVNGNEIDIHTGNIIDQSLAYIDIVAADNLVANRFVDYEFKHPMIEKKAIGVTETNTLEGEVAKIRYNGIGLVETSTAINIGDKLICDLYGKAKKTLGSLYQGRSLDTIAEPGIVRILLSF